MKKKTFFLIALLATFSIANTFAQERATIQMKPTTWDNWFISGGLSGNLLLGEQDGDKGVGDRTKFGGQFTVGKWLTPTFGIRAQFLGGSLRGYNTTDNQGGEYTREDRKRDLYPTGYYDNKLNYVDAAHTGFWQDFSHSALTVDLMTNLTHLFRGFYKENCPVEVIPFVGFGWMHANESNTNPVFDGVVTKLGGRINFNLNKQWAIFVEGQGSFVSDQFDGYVGNRGIDATMNGIAGVQVNINKNFKSIEALSLEEIDILNKKINNQRQMIDNQQEILERQQQMLNDLKNQPQGTNTKEIIVKEGANNAYLPQYIRFKLNSYQIESSEKPKLQEAIEYLKSHSGSNLLLVGYADRLTGNSTYNLELSRKRVEAVVAEFVQNGIPKNRLISKWEGDKVQPYEQNEWNRVVIMVER